RRHIFEPFFTTKKDKGGSGLGLAILFATIRRLGGYVAVDSQLGSGTAFRIYLPAAGPGTGKSISSRRPDVAAEPRSAPVQAKPGNGPTILLVEDEPALLSSLQGLIESEGFRVLTAANGDEALKIYEKAKGDGISLIFSDVEMPRMSGNEVF